MPEDSMYLPIFVGSHGRTDIEGYTRDDIGDNISELNPLFCELTATYYLWKNTQADYKGLVHYRRHFSNLKHFGIFKTGKFDNVMTKKKAKQLLSNYDVILPEKRNYYIETLYSHYQHSHNIADLEETKKVIADLYPEYLSKFDEVMQHRSAHMFNMYIMRSNLFDAYSKWMFTVLFELKNRIDTSKYSTQEQRVFGYISELLLDVWLEVNQISYVEDPVMFMEKQNWSKKLELFLLRKIKR